jgi:nicotinate-nucleotide pyrophosphorylase (carboxylating)
MARQLRRRFPDTLIEIEVDTLDQLGALLAGAAGAAAADIILLDNMTVEQMAAAVRMRNQFDPSCRILLEASGGITLATVRAIAQTGVERISVGAITHSAKALDVSLEIELPTST